MTRRDLPLLAGAILFCGVAAGAPAHTAHLRAESVGARFEHRPEARSSWASRTNGEPVGVDATARRTSTVPAFDVYVGDGIFRLRLQGCETCETAITIEVGLGQLRYLLQLLLTI